MFFEDHRVGVLAELGRVVVTREAILAYARAYDPRVLAREAAGAPLTASGLHIAALAMRAIIDWRDRARAEIAARGEPVPPLGVSPGLTDLRWPIPARPGDVIALTTTTTSLRETRRPQWGLVGSQTRGVNQRGDEVLRFSSLVMTARRPA